MNLIKIMLFGFSAWIIPFVFCLVIFPDLSLGFQFVLYLLTATFALIEYSNSRMSGYLHKRNKITVGAGLTIGLVWFILSYLFTGIYLMGLKGDSLFDYSVNYGSIFLMYPILSTLVGFCEERRGRRR